MSRADWPDDCKLKREKQPRALWVLRAVVCSFKELLEETAYVIGPPEREKKKKTESEPNGPKGHAACG